MNSVYSNYNDFLFVARWQQKNVGLTLSNVVDINVEIHNVDSTLLDVVHFSVKIHNVVSPLIRRCPTPHCRINQKTTLKQRWNVCWVKDLMNICFILNKKILDLFLSFTIWQEYVILNWILKLDTVSEVLLYHNFHFTVILID